MDTATQHIYHDFDLVVGQADERGKYPLSVVQSPSGAIADVVWLPIRIDDLALSEWNESLLYAARNKWRLFAHSPLQCL